MLVVVVVVVVVGLFLFHRVLFGGIVVEFEMSSNGGMGLVL